MERHGKQAGTRQMVDLLKLGKQDSAPGLRQRKVTPDSGALISGGAILIELGSARVSIEGAPDPASIPGPLLASATKSISGTEFKLWKSET